MNGFLTIYDIALAKASADGVDVSQGLTGETFERYGLPMFGGCLGCRESLGAYNAYPSISGYLCCRACLGTFGYMSVQAFDDGEIGVRERAGFERDGFGGGGPYE